MKENTRGIRVTVTATGTGAEKTKDVILNGTKNLVPVTLPRVTAESITEIKLPEGKYISLKTIFLQV